jgi:hypothetical protein
MAKWIGAACGLGAGLGCVVGVGAYMASTVPAPKFGKGVNRYDTSTFLGRYSSFLSSMDPSTLLSSDDEVREAVRKLKDYHDSVEAASQVKGVQAELAAQLAAAKYTDAQLWAAHKLKESAVHPDTGEIIPQAVRMSGYVPYNGPVCVGMMVAKSTTGLLFWSFVNQSQNALVNYFNRNASSAMSNETLAISYASAVSAALLVCLLFACSSVFFSSFFQTC